MKSITDRYMFYTFVRYMDYKRIEYWFNTYKIKIDPYHLFLGASYDNPDIILYYKNNHIDVYKEFEHKIENIATFYKSERVKQILLQTPSQ